MKIRAFTDGACSGNPGPGGWASCILLKDCQKMFSGGAKETTNNRMELTSVIKAIQAAYKEEECKEIEIFSDSAYVVNAINSNWLAKWKGNDWKNSECKDIKNKDLWVELSEELELLSSFDINITIIKVKGHSGNFFNELVDKVAKKEVEKYR